MKLPKRLAYLKEMRGFLLVWSGQSVSLVGTSITGYAVALWLFERTGRATDLVFVLVARLVSELLTNFFAGVIVDRVDRKKLIVLGDVVAVVATSAYLLLFKAGRLEPWHLYLGALLTGPFDGIQRLAFASSATMMVPKESYSRVAGFNWLTLYSKNIITPWLATVIYLTYGLQVVLLVDIATFFIAIGTVLFVPIPRSEEPEDEAERPLLRERLLYGIKLIFSIPSLRGLLLVQCAFVFFHDISGGIYTPMILASTDNNQEVLATVVTASGLSGVLSSLVMSNWKGFKDRVKGFLVGTISAGFGKMLFGLSRSVTTWAPVQFYTSANFPVKGSSFSAIWRTKIKPEEQGRVFAAVSLGTGLFSMLGFLVGGPLGDFVFEPALAQGGRLTPSLSWLVGSGPGAGYSLLFFLAGVGMLLSGVVGFFIPAVKNLEAMLEDQEDEQLGG